MNRFIVIVLLLYFFLLCSAQEYENEKPIKLTYQSSMLGIGGTSLYDTYLSPIKYKGTTIGLFHEQIKMAGMMNGKVAVQHQFSFDFSWSDNDAETASDYSGFLEYNYGLLYRLKPINNLQLFAGAQADGLLGFIYNTRNGNNPATAKVHLNLNLSGIAAYQFKIKSQPLLVRYQLNLPFAGAMFSPHFGQSYYEISLGDSDDIIYFSSFHNHFIMKNLLTVELPFKSTILRLSYINSIYETDINDIQTRVHSNSFFIGFSRNFFTVQGKKSDKRYKRFFE